MKSKTKLYRDYFISYEIRIPVQWHVIRVLNVAHLVVQLGKADEKTGATLDFQNW